jgi:phosphatidylserine/phosphatidylglycerophosphate/cardiolipin synthase-like enzyme
MSTKRPYTGRLTNPLPNVEEPGAASDVYAEDRAYGPIAQAGGGTSPLFHDHHRFIVDAAADPVHRQVRAVWDGNLYISKVINPDETDPAKQLVWLALERLPGPFTRVPTAFLLDGMDRVPGVAFYGNVRHQTLHDAMLALGYDTPDDVTLLDRWLDLTAVGGQVSTVLPVRAGDQLGELGEIALDGGGNATALDFKLALAKDGRDPVYPDGFYKRADAFTADGLFLGGLGGPFHERNPTLSLWAVTERRVIVWCRDEWNRLLGVHRPADVTLTRDDGATLRMSFPQLNVGQEPLGGFALGDWAEGHATAGVEARPFGRPNAAPLLLSEVPTDAAAGPVLGIELETPAEFVVQALDPDDWFPAQGGSGWDPGPPRRHTEVSLPAPHAPARFTNGNRVTPLLDGTPYFKDLARELDRITDSSHFLCLAKWWVDHDFALAQTYDHAQYPPVTVDSDARTIEDHWQRIAGLGAPVLALMWNQTGGPLAELPAALPPGPLKNLFTSIQDHEELARAFAGALLASEAAGGAYNPNSDAVAALNAVAGPGATEAILDGRTRPGGSHHAKLAVVNNADGLVAWVGGIDINTIRISTTAHHDYEPGFGPYHDVQCRIEGPAARDVLRTFISRWNDHPAMGFDPDDPNWVAQPDLANGKSRDIACGALGFPSGPRATHQLVVEESDDRSGTDLVQIARTFGNTRGLEDEQIHNGGDFRDDNGYAFAPDGDFTIEAAILGAIKRAKRYIYIEDQFLANMKIATAVADRIVERRDAIAADPDGEEPFYVYILVPYFPNSTKTATDLGAYTRPADALKRFAQWAAEKPEPSASLVGKLIELAKAQGGPVPDRFETVDTFGYLQTRWFSLLSSVDNNQEHWQMHCLRLPPYVTRQGNFGHWATGGTSLEPLPLDERRTYIHTKIVIVDDIWATIGSANMCVRSYTMDSEINCSFIDGRTDDRGLRVSVRELRRALWADHWGVGLNEVPDAPGNDPAVIAKWKSHVSPAASLPVSGGGTKPSGSHLYEWPFDEVNVSTNDQPKITWSHNGAPVVIQPHGIEELPVFFWISEQYGKAPWDPDDDELMPPPIGSDRFTFDLKDGVQYQGFDLVPHPDPP